MTEAILKTERAGAIEHLILNRPDSLNSLNQPMADALLAYFRAKQRDTETRVILISGAGRGFCSGADLKGWRDQTPDRLRDGPDGDWLLRDMLKAMRACPQPIVALAIHIEQHDALHLDVFARHVVDEIDHFGLHAHPLEMAAGEVGVFAGHA